MSIFNLSVGQNPIQSRPVVIEPFDPAASPNDEYKKLAKKLGISLAKPKSVELEKILSEEMIHFFPLASVSAYMLKMCPSGKVWGWKSLRSKDRDISDKKIVFGHTSAHGRFFEGVYNKAVPLPVLLTIDKIEQAATECSLPLAFFVSDYEVRMPDPFLLVMIPSRESQYQEAHEPLWEAKPEPSCFVVERWDEPSFR